MSPWGWFWNLVMFTVKSGKKRNYQNKRARTVQVEFRRIADSLYYVSWIQLPEYFGVFSFSCKHWIPKANGKTMLPINITNKIPKGILVAVFSRCIKGTSHCKSECHRRIFVTTRIWLVRTNTVLLISNSYKSPSNDVLTALPPSQKRKKQSL